MARDLLRSIRPSQWVAPLLTSLVFHAFLLVLALLLWSDPEQHSEVAVESINIDLVAPPDPKSLDKQSPAVEPEPAKSPKPKPLPATADQPPVQQPEALKPSARKNTHKQSMVVPSKLPDRTELDVESQPVIKETYQSEDTASNIDQMEPVSQAVDTPSTPTESADLDSLRAAYLQKISILIDRQKSYPLMARKSRQQGTALMAFTLTRDGILNSCQVQQSSGYRLLDRAAEKAVRKVRLFPPPPVSFDERLIFQVAISFRLDD